MEETTDEFSPGDEVDVVVLKKTDIGYNVIINDRFKGLIHNSDVLTKLTIGEKRKGYIKPLREDQKLDVSLSRPGYGKVLEITGSIVERLKANGGILMLTDKSPPEEIYAQFQVSKKTFKQAIGALYKQKIILIESDRITLCNL
ncbi:MAG: hypothetical protein R6V47_02955 [Candidatus Delongbacteria bacterium]